MEAILTRLSESVPQAQSLEELTRPLLELLEAVTGLESTYFTTIDLAHGLQHVRYARNTGPMQIPEGLDVPWADTLCKRALEEGRMYTPNVAECWGDSDAARALGIQTYVSAPVCTHGGELLGTLCAASSASRPLEPAATSVLNLFSRLIGSWVERERLVADLESANARLTTQARTDFLTGLANRRAVLDELGRMLARARREGTKVLVALIDLDGFKTINDTHGHPLGDLLLTEVSKRMAGALRATDMIGRIGGDEFAVIAPGPPAARGAADAVEAAARALSLRLSEATAGSYALNHVLLDYPGASVGVVAMAPEDGDAEEALRVADAQMYRVKRQRKELSL